MRIHHQIFTITALCVLLPLSGFANQTQPGKTKAPAAPAPVVTQAAPQAASSSLGGALTLEGSPDQLGRFGVTATVTFSEMFNTWMFSDGDVNFTYRQDNAGRNSRALYGTIRGQARGTTLGIAVVTNAAGETVPTIIAGGWFGHPLIHGEVFLNAPWLTTTSAAALSAGIRGKVGDTLTYRTGFTLGKHVLAGVFEEEPVVQYVQAEVNITDRVALNGQFRADVSKVSNFTSSLGVKLSL